MEASTRIGFIGAGNMAQAIGINLIEKKIIPPSQIYVSAPSEKNFRPWSQFEVNTTHDNREVILNSDIIFLAIKPQYVDNALRHIRVSTNEWTFPKLVVSVIAGLSFETLHSKLEPILPSYRLIKAIPNTALLVGEGCTVICPDTTATSEDLTLVEEIMSIGGSYEIVPEPLMNAASALTGCGIAFGYSIIEALSDGVVKQGVPRVQSYKLAAQTLLGAAKMVLDTGEHPGQLKDNVCSPGGTTIHGIHALEKGALRSTLIDAIEASTTRAYELDKKNKI